KRGSQWSAALGLLVFALAVFAGPPLDVPKPDPDLGKLIVHEWGTFLSVQGSDGQTLGGMIESEERLPNFVRERALDGRNRACLNSKMETPVTYFYVDRPRTVQVRVDMPRGLLTHWYPAVQTFGPTANHAFTADPNVDDRTTSGNSFLDWGTVEQVPDSRAEIGPNMPIPRFKSVRADDTWRFARQTDAAFVGQQKGANTPQCVIATKKGQVFTGSVVRSTETEWVLRDASERDVVIPLADIEEKVLVRDGRTARVLPQGEREKFLFYRGLGALDLPLEVRSSGAGDE